MGAERIKIPFSELDRISDNRKMSFAPTGVSFSTADGKWQRVFDAAERTEKNNIVLWHGKRVLVEGGVYQGLWLETQPMGGDMYSDRCPETAWNNQNMFIDLIRDDGRIPSVIRFEDDGAEIMYSHFQGYCFPYHALNVWYRTGKDMHYLNRLYDCLSRFDSYLWRTRDTDGNGCLESFCVWDTGEDGSTRFFGAPDAWGSDTPPYGQAKLPYESMDVMAYCYDGRVTLSEIAAILGNGEEKKWRDGAETVRRTLNSYLWREEKGALYDRDCDNNFLDTLIHNNLRVMYHGAYEYDKAMRFVREHLLNPEEFFTPMPLTSIAANDRLFVSDPDNNWSGQPEGLTYQRSLRAFENYRLYDLLPVFGQKLCGALAQNDPVIFTQQFDPYTGKPQAAFCTATGDYGPTILAFLGYTSHLYGVELVRDTAVFSTCPVSGGCEYTLTVGEKAFTVKNNGRKAAVSVDGREIITVPAGTRVVTDAGGNLIKTYPAFSGTDA